MKRVLNYYSVSMFGNMKKTFVLFLLSVVGFLCVAQPGEPTFSVGPKQKVRIASGNLQFQPSTRDYRFAPRQYEAIGSPNEMASAIYDGWIDLFGWGAGSSPALASQEAADYRQYNEFDDIRINGYAGRWRMLSSFEWAYLVGLNGNAQRKGLSGGATIDGRYKGLVILPDGFVCPDSLEFVPVAFGVLDFSSNRYTVSQWEALESLGAIFLPAAGMRHGRAVSGVWDDGGYWSSSINGMGVHCLHAGATLDVDTSEPQYARSVRLVQDVR